MTILCNKPLTNPDLLGIKRGISLKDYHAGDGLSKGDLDLIAVSPMHYQASLDNPPEQTEAMLIGSAFHSYVLEPEKFDKEYARRPKFDKRTKDGKIEAEKWECENFGKTPLSTETVMMLSGMSTSMMSNPIMEKLITNTEHEVSGYAEIDGVLCKCRPDGWDEKNNVIIDLKSTTDASLDGFRRAVSRGRYHVQAAWYSMIMEEITGEPVRGFYFFACEKTYPYASAIYELDLETVSVGKALAMRDLARYKRAYLADEWEGYPQTVQSLRLSGWELSQAINE